MDVLSAGPNAGSMHIKSSVAAGMGSSATRTCQCNMTALR